MILEPISIEMSQIDAAVAAVVLAEYAGRQALQALVKDAQSLVGGTTNAEERALAESCSRASLMLADALMEKDAGVQSAYALKQSVESMAVAAAAACKARGEQE